MASDREAPDIRSPAAERGPVVADDGQPPTVQVSPECSNAAN
jgi:hypothetical protein